MTFPIVADATGEIFSLLGLVRSDAIDPTQGIVAQVGGVLPSTYIFLDSHPFACYVTFTGQDHL